MFTQALLVGSLALGVYAQNQTTTAQTTMKLFLDSTPDQEFVGSVVSADCDATTYALRCTEGDYGSGILSQTCGPNQPAVRATYGPNRFAVSTEAETYGLEGTIIETCSLEGTTKAMCVASVGIDYQGSEVATQSTATLTGSDVHYYQVPITAGVEKLPTCTGSADSSNGGGSNDSDSNDSDSNDSDSNDSDSNDSDSGNSGSNDSDSNDSDSDSPSENAAAPVAAGVSVYKVLVVPGAAALLAGAGAFA